jgi:hypothetical protein
VSRTQSSRARERFTAGQHLGESARRGVIAEIGSARQLGDVVVLRQDLRQLGRGLRIACIGELP